VLRKLHNGLIFAVSALLIYFLLFVNIPSLVEAQTQRWYAGYFYAGTPISAPWGVSGKIYTINPQVPALTTMFQWVTVVLSYVNDYWLQVGYDKTNSLFHPTYITYYWECVSQRGSYTHQHFSGNPGPTAGSWHSYTIVYAQSSQFPERWILRVDFGTPQTTCDVYPYNPEDLQAFVETTYSRIRIDGSHFKDLSRYTGHGWPYWDRHVVRVDNPYSLYRIWRADCGYNCEFTAAGGG
jgi:hypothetical protein